MNGFYHSESCKVETTKTKKNYYQPYAEPVINKKNWSGECEFQSVFAIENDKTRWHFGVPEGSILAFYKAAGRNDIRLKYRAQEPLDRRYLYPWKFEQGGWGTCFGCVRDPYSDYRANLEFMADGSQLRFLSLKFNEAYAESSRGSSVIDFVSSTEAYRLTFSPLPRSLSQVSLSSYNDPGPYYGTPIDPNANVPIHVGDKIYIIEPARAYDFSIENLSTDWSFSSDYTVKLYWGSLLIWKSKFDSRPGFLASDSQREIHLENLNLWRGIKYRLEVSVRRQFSGSGAPQDMEIQTAAEFVY